MDWNWAYTWLSLAVAFALLELLVGAFVLLAMGAACAVGAGAAYLGAGITVQLLSIAIAAGILIPLGLAHFKRRLSPSKYGTTGTGVEKGRIYTTLKRDYDGATAITINGDTYRVRRETDPRHAGEGSPEAEDITPGTQVEFSHFEGTTAIVKPVDSRERP